MAERFDWRAARGIEKPTCDQLLEHIKKEVAQIDDALARPQSIDSNWLDRAWPLSVESLIYDVLTFDCGLSEEKRAKMEEASERLMSIDRSLMQTNRRKTTKTYEKLKEVRQIAADIL